MQTSSNPRELTTVDELDALPVRSVILDGRGFAWQKFYGDFVGGTVWYSATNVRGSYLSSYFVNGGHIPVIVVHEPGEGNRS